MNNDLLILEKKINMFNALYTNYKKQNSINDLELKEIICDVLNWLEICLKNTKTPNKLELEKISGFRHINNIRKHNSNIYKYTLHSLALYPSNDLYPSDTLYPSDFNIYWDTFQLDNAKYINQYNNYKKHFNGVNVYSSINEIYSIIKKHYK